MRTWAFVVIVSLFSVVLPGGDADGGEGPQVFFREPFETGAVGWWGDPYWQLSSDRTNSGTNALHFGDQETGTMFCEEVICHLEVRSPVFHIAAGSPAHLYFWAYLDAYVEDDVLAIDVETLGTGDDVVDRERVFSTALGKDWVFHADLSAFAGSDVRLVFIASLWHVHEWETGIFVDDVVVTDRYVETEFVSVVTGDGPTARVRFDVSPGDRRIIQLRVEGKENAFEHGVASYVQRDGAPPDWSARSSSWGTPGLGIVANATDPVSHYHIEADVAAQGFGMPLLDQDLTQTTFSDRSWSYTHTFQTNMWDPGHWDTMLSVFGAGNTTATVVVRSQSTGAVAAAVGGETIGYGYAADLDADLFLGSRHGPWSLSGGRGSWSADGPSLGFFVPYAEVNATPVQSSPNGPFSVALDYADAPGEWSFSLDHAAGPYTFSMFHINTVPERPAPRTLPVPELNEIPFGPRAGEVRYPASGERPWSFWGSIGCQVNVLGTGTDPSCGLFPLVWRVAHFPLVANGGLIGIDYRLASDGPMAGTLDGTTIGDTCLTVTTASFDGQGCQTGGDRETLLAGAPLLTEGARLDVDLAKDDPGVAWQDQSLFDLYFRYDLSRVPPLGG